MPFTLDSCLERLAEPWTESDVVRGAELVRIYLVGPDGLEDFTDAIDNATYAVEEQDDPEFTNLFRTSFHKARALVTISVPEGTPKEDIETIDLLAGAAAIGYATYDLATEDGPFTIEQRDYLIYPWNQLFTEEEGIEDGI